MKVGNLIEIDWQDTLKKADRLEELAGQLEKVRDNQLQSVEAAGGSKWKGTPADLYRKRAKTFSRQIDAEVRTLKKTAGKLKSIAQIYQKLESIHPFGE